MSVIYGYIRVSTSSQVTHGMSLDAQAEAVASHARFLTGRDPSLTTAKVYREEGVSASKRPFHCRPKGSELCKKMKQGDHLVIAKLDRGFRSTTDCLSQLKRWAAQGVVVHLLDIGVDTSTPMGQLLIGILAVIAEWESARRGERIRDALEQRRKTNPTAAPTGIRVIGYRLMSDGTLVPHDEERFTGALVSQMRRDGSTWDEILAEVNRRELRRPSSPHGNRQQREEKNYTKSMLSTLARRCRRGWPINPSDEGKGIQK